MANIHSLHVVDNHIEFSYLACLNEDFDDWCGEILSYTPAISEMLEKYGTRITFQSHDDAILAYLWLTKNIPLGKTRIELDAKGIHYYNEFNVPRVTLGI